MIRILLLAWVVIRSLTLPVAYQYFHFSWGVKNNLKRTNCLRHLWGFDIRRWNRNGMCLAITLKRTAVENERVPWQQCRVYRSRRAAGESPAGASGHKTRRHNCFNYLFFWTWISFKDQRISASQTIGFSSEFTILIITTWTLLPWQPATATGSVNVLTRTRSYSSIK